MEIWCKNGAQEEWVAWIGDCTIEFAQTAGDIFHASLAGHRDREGRLIFIPRSVHVFIKILAVSGETNLEWLNHGGEEVDATPRLRGRSTKGYRRRICEGS